MADDVGSLLLRAGMIAPQQLEEARAVVGKVGGTIPEQLVLQGHLDDEDLTGFYCRRLLIPRINPSQLAKLPHRILEKLPSDMANEFRSVPISIDSEGSLTLVMSDPSDTKAADEIGFFTGCYIVRAIATQAQIAWCLAHFYKQATPLYKDLVSQGNWPEAKPKEEKVATADTKPLSKKREKPEAKTKAKKLQRPANQQPSPPELNDRAGEISSIKNLQRNRTHSLQPAVVIGPLEDAKPTTEYSPEKPPPTPLELELDAIPKDEQRGTDTAPFLLSSIVGKSVVEENSEPLLLGKKKATVRRPARHTFVGVGAMGADEKESPWETALAEHTKTRDSSVHDTIQMKQLFLEEEKLERESTEEAEEEDTQVENDTVEEEEEEETTNPAIDSLNRAVMDKVDLEIEAEIPPSRIKDMVGDVWGKPGNTIPPAFLGAIPQVHENSTESIPVAIDDDITTQLQPSRTQKELARSATEPMPEAQTAAGTPAPSVSQLNQQSTAIPRPVPIENSSKMASRVLSTLRAIDRAEDKAQVVAPLLEFLDIAYERTGFLALRTDELVSWKLHGCSESAKTCIEIENDSCLSDVCRIRLPYAGPLEDDSCRQLASDLELADANTILALPMVLKGRVIGVLLGLTVHDITLQEHVAVLSEAACEAFERIILNRK